MTSQPATFGGGWTRLHVNGKPTVMAVDGRRRRTSTEHTPHAFYVVRTASGGGVLLAQPDLGGPDLSEHERHRPGSAGQDATTEVLHRCSVTR
jgi:hypothetical protein